MGATFGVLLRGLDHGDDLGLDDRAEEFLLAREVEVDRPLRDTGAAGDLVEARPFETSVAEDLEGGLDELAGAVLRESNPARRPRFGEDGGGGGGPRGGGRPRRARGPVRGGAGGRRLAPCRRTRDAGGSRGGGAGRGRGGRRRCRRARWRSWRIAGRAPGSGSCTPAFAIVWRRCWAATCRAAGRRRWCGASSARGSASVRGGRRVRCCRAIAVHARDRLAETPR